MMSKIYLCLAVFLLATSSFAARVQYFKAVLESEALASALREENSQDVLVIKNTQVYRCPGCYDFEVTISTGMADEKSVTFSTESGFGKNSVVQVKRK